MLPYCGGAFEFEVFAADILFNKIRTKEMKRRLKNYKKRTYSEKSAIKLIKNLIVAALNMYEERIDYHTYSCEVLFYLTKFIKVKHLNKNCKILYALYKSQVNEEETKLKGSYLDDVITEMELIYKDMVEEDKKKCQYFMKKFEIIKNNT